MAKATKVGRGLEDIAWVTGSLEMHASPHSIHNNSRASTEETQEGFVDGTFLTIQIHLIVFLRKRLPEADGQSSS